MIRCMFLFVNIAPCSRTISVHICVILRFTTSSYNICLHVFMWLKFVSFVQVSVQTRVRIGISPAGPGHVSLRRPRYSDPPT